MKLDKYKHFIKYYNIIKKHVEWLKEDHKFETYQKKYKLIIAKCESLYVYYY